MAMINLTILIQLQPLVIFAPARGKMQTHHMKLIDIKTNIFTFLSYIFFVLFSFFICGLHIC